MGKREIARNKQFLLFPQYFLPFWKTFCHFHQINSGSLQTLLAWKSLKFVIWERVKPLFARKHLVDASRFLVKRQWLKIFNQLKDDKSLDWYKSK